MEGLQGRHVRDALDAHRARTTPDPDVVRQLFEQIGTLYEIAEAAEPRTIKISSDEQTRSVQEVADFLDTVHRAVRSPGGQTAAALRLALHRYEQARDPQGRA